MKTSSSWIVAQLILSVLVNGLNLSFQALSHSLPVILLAHFYGVAVAGAYAFGVSLIAKPIEFVLRSLRQVLFQKASETFNEGLILMPLYLKNTLGLFAAAVFPVLIFFLWAPPIFVFVFGDQWHLAGKFSRFIVLWRMFMFCNLPSTLFSRIIRIQGRIFVFDLFVLATRASVLYLGGKYLSAINTIIVFSMIGVILNIILILLVGIALMKIEGYNIFNKRPEKS